MTKIEIYPYKKEAKKKLLHSTDKPPYNLSASDVDWEAKPSIAELHNWVNGTVTQYYEHTEYIESLGLECNTFEPFKTVKSREIPCLKAVVDMNGSTMQVEEWRTKIVKEDKPMESREKPITPYKHPEGKRPTEIDILEINAMMNEYNDIFRQYEHLFDEDLKILHKDYIFELRKLFSR